MERDDKDMLEVTRDWRRALQRWIKDPDAHIPAWLALVAFFLLVLIAVFSINAFRPGGIGDIIGGSSQTDADGGSDSSTPDGGADSPLEEEPAVGQEVPVVAPEEPAPAHFVGTIVSDNGWFTITVRADGQVSGTLTVSQTVEGAAVVQKGSFAGTITDDDLISCTGTFTGTSTDAKGQKWPHEGSVTVRATPTSEGRTTWQIDADGEPGDPVSLSAHAR